MEQNLYLICKKYFTNVFDITAYTNIIVRDININFSSGEISYLTKCLEKNIDLEALELELRSIHKNNILSFIFLRLSAIAESLAITQSQYINKKPLNIFSVFIFLSTTAINFILLKVKAKLIYKNLIKEYPNV
jgi:hypothetical protein